MLTLSAMSRQSKWSRKLIHSHADDLLTHTTQVDDAHGHGGALWLCVMDVAPNILV